MQLALLITGIIMFVWGLSIKTTLIWTLGVAIMLDSLLRLGRPGTDR